MFYTQIPTYCTFNTKWLIWVSLHTHYTVCSSRVFVLADPAVFVRAHLEASSLLMNTATSERAAVLRVLQTGLGTTCQSSGLARVVEVSKFIKMFWRKWEGCCERSTTLDQTDISEKLEGNLPLEFAAYIQNQQRMTPGSCDVFIVNKRHFTTFCLLEGQHKGLVIIYHRGHQH